jgi:uncharacterized membrane protein YiaA
MNYFISRNDQQYGPYTLADLQRYIAAGSILVSDMTRSEGMTEWVPVSQVIGNIPVPVAVRPAELGLSREGNKLIVIRGAMLPPYCVKCAQPADGVPWEKNFAWSSPLLALWLILGLLGIVIYLIGYYSARKQMKLMVPLCEEHRRARRTKLWVGSLLLITSPLLMVIGIAVSQDWVTGLGFFAFLVMAISGAVVLILSQPLRPKRIDDRQGRFAGAREPYLAFIDSRGIDAHSQPGFGTAY